MKQEGTWPRAWTAEIGAALARHRKRRGLSAAKLSERCSEVGFPIPRNTIANLENGRKESVPIHEVVVLATALGVAPLDLLFPAALGDVVALLPAAPESAVKGAMWFVGAGDDDTEISFYINHSARVNALREASKGEPDDGAAGAAERVASLRESMAARDLPLPEIPDDVRWWFEPDEQGAPNYRMGEGGSMFGRPTNG